MVPWRSMTPFPMLPFDMIWAGCTEYIPRRRKSNRARGQCGRSAHDDEHDDEPNWRTDGRVLGRARLAR